MVQKEIKIKFSEFEDINDLESNVALNISLAEENLANAYAPYSNFKVSAMVLLKNGTKILGNNQENAAYPSGLCAERVAIFAASANHPDEVIEQIIITTEASNSTPFSPCGACRQVLMEYEMKQQAPIEVVLKSGDSKIWKFSRVEDLLPFAFKADGLLKKN